MSWGWGGGWRPTNTLRTIAFGAEMGKRFGTFPVEVGKKETSQKIHWNYQALT